MHYVGFMHARVCVGYIVSTLMYMGCPTLRIFTHLPRTLVTTIMPSHSSLPDAGILTVNSKELRSPTGLIKNLEERSLGFLLAYE